MLVYQRVRSWTLQAKTVQFTPFPPNMQLNMLNVSTISQLHVQLLAATLGSPQCCEVCSLASRIWQMVAGVLWMCFLRSGAEYRRIIYIHIQVQQVPRVNQFNPSQQFAGKHRESAMGNFCVPYLNKFRVKG